MEIKPLFPGLRLQSLEPTYEVSCDSHVASTAGGTGLPGAGLGFFLHPRNLNALTPDELCFRIVGETADTMYEGQIIEYHVRFIKGSGPHG
jgi:hypothetical protein